MAVMALGKRERAEIKAFGNGVAGVGGGGGSGWGEDRRGRGAEGEGEDGTRMSAAFESRGGRVGKDGLPIALVDAKAPSASESPRSFRLFLPSWTQSDPLERVPDQHSNRTTCAVSKPPSAASRNSSRTSKPSKTG